jgi:hypothetical protein
MMRGGATPVAEEKRSVRFTTPWSSLMMQEMDNMLTGGNEFGEEDGGDTIHP